MTLISYDILCNLSELCDKDGNDVANACQDLKGIVDADQTVVAWVRGQVVLLHNIHARSRNGGKVAAT